MDDLNITMEDYIQLMADKARGRDQMFNWETATYGEVYCDDSDLFTNFETDFPAIVYNDASTSNQNVSSEPTSILKRDVSEIMTKTMEQYMSKTYGEYGSGIARPKIDAKFQFELKGQFLKELRDNTFSGSEHEDVNKHIEKEVILFSNRLDVPTRQILDSRGAIPTKIATDAKVVIQEMDKFSQKWHNGTSLKSRSTKTSDGVGCELCKGPHYTKDCPLKEEVKTLEEAYYTQFGTPIPPEDNTEQQGPDSLSAKMEILRTLLKRNNGRIAIKLEHNPAQMSKVLQERGFGSLPSSTKTNPKDQVKSISTATADLSKIPRMEAHELKILDAHDRNLPQKEKDPGSFTLPCFINNICFDKALVDLGRTRALEQETRDLNVEIK
ncbi:retrotransposon protein [Tanacetum coccineum]|uniref:Retrotransposon protein n=1 Tax=Tanacetum coccineum TaxID=301880 RepID=A0ABQ5IPK5_9ASTR